MRGVLRQGNLMLRLDSGAMVFSGDEQGAYFLVPDGCGWVPTKDLKQMILQLQEWLAKAQGVISPGEEEITSGRA